MLKSTRAFCEYIIILYTTGYNPSRAAVCMLLVLCTLPWQRFIFVVFLVFLVVCCFERKCCLPATLATTLAPTSTRRSRQHQHHFCRWWMQRMHACSARWAWRLPSTTASYSGALPPCPPFLLPGRLPTCQATKQLCKFVGHRFALFHQKLPKNNRQKQRQRRCTAAKLAFIVEPSASTHTQHPFSPLGV